MAFPEVVPHYRPAPDLPGGRLGLNLRLSRPAENVRPPRHNEDLLGRAPNPGRTPC